MVWVNNQVERPRIVAARNLAVGNQMVVVVLYAEQTSKSWAAALAQVEPHVIGKRALRIRTLYSLKKRVDVCHCLSQRGAGAALNDGERHGCQDIRAGWLVFAPVATVKVNKKIADRATEVLKRLKVIYPEAICELTHDSAFQLLAATILSAQCTDARVNMVTPALFAEFPTAEKLSVANVERVEELVRSTGFYQTKAKNLVGMARGVVDRFGGEVPTAIEDLITLPGVGRKTANVLRSVVFDLPGLAVDTHVGRLSRRLGLTKEEDPVKV